MQSRSPGQSSARSYPLSQLRGLTASCTPTASRRSRRECRTASPRPGACAGSPGTWETDTWTAEDSGHSVKQWKNEKQQNNANPGRAFVTLAPGPLCRGWGQVRAHICHKYHKLYLWRKICHVEKFQISVKNLNNLWSFIEIYAVFVLNLYGEKSVWRKSLWRKNDKYEV